MKKTILAFMAVTLTASVALATKGSSTTLDSLVKATPLVVETFESLLPKSAKDFGKEVIDGYGFFVQKVQVLNPNFSNKAKINADLNIVLIDYKKNKPSLKELKLPTIGDDDYDKMIADAQKVYGITSAFATVLTTIRDNIEKVNSDGEMFESFKVVLKSSDFSKMTADQKNTIYNAFAAMKYIKNYHTANNLPLTSTINVNLSYGACLVGGNFSIQSRSARLWLRFMVCATAGCLAGPAGCAVGCVVGAAVVIAS